MRKILSLEDLIAFCEQHDFARFSSSESGYQICVQVPATFEKSEHQDDSLFFGNVLAFHTGINRNHSNLTIEAAKKAIKTLAYKPVLANFCEIDGVRDFTSHDFDIDDDGNFVYYEKQIGCFTADAAKLEQDPDHDDRMNVYAKVAIPRDYTDAADIIERKGGTACSVELAVNELSWDQSNKTLKLLDVTILGLTCLGVDPESGREVLAGMENAHIQIEDFSMENNSVVFNKSELVDEITNAVIEQLSNNMTDDVTYNQRKEETADMDFEENIKEATVEEMEVETAEEETVTEEMSEETVAETPEVVEAFGDDESGDDSNDDTDDTDGNGDDDSDDGSDDQEDETSDDEEWDPALHDDEPSGQTRHFSINEMNFEVSLSEIQFSISELVNATYSETDNDYYMVEVYEGSKTVVMNGMFTGRSYRQGYKVRNNVYSLVGDRVPVKAVYVTADEEAELDKMRSNYSAISSKLEKYEAEPEKMEILNSKDYANIADQEDFIELKKQEKHFDLSIDEVKEQADAMLLAYAKSGKLNFAATEEVKEEPKKDFFAFARIESNTSFLDGLLRK